MKISSRAFRNEELIPQPYSRDGQDKSPPLHMEGVPTNAQSLVLIVDDPDAPHGTFTHWILFDLDPRTVDLDEGRVPQHARQGTNDWGQENYGGPKPPSGEHRYFFRLFALDRRLDLPHGATLRQIEKAMHGHVLASAELMGRFDSASVVGLNAS